MWLHDRRWPLCGGYGGMKKRFKRAAREESRNQETRQQTGMVV